MSELAGRPKLGDIWSIIALWREVQPHVTKVMDESLPWRERLECGLHLAQIAAAHTETGLDNQALEFLAEGGWDDLILDALAEILEKLVKNEPQVYGSAEVGSISITVLIQIAMFIWQIIQQFTNK